MRVRMRGTWVDLSGWITEEGDVDAPRRRIVNQSLAKPLERRVHVRLSPRHCVNLDRDGN